MFRVTLIGPDGCGKSAVVEQLIQRMRVPVRRIYMGVNLESSNIMLPTSRIQLAIRRWRGAPADADGPQDPSTRNKTGGSILKRTLRFVKGGIRTSNLIAEECYRLLVIRWWLLRGFVVVQDRDFFVDYFEYDVADTGHRTIWQVIHGFFLKHVYSQPDLTILLDVSAQTMLKRKKEGTANALERRRIHYRDFLNCMPASDIVDGEGDLNDVTTNCLDRIMKHRQKIIADTGGETRVRVDGPVAVIVGSDSVTGLQTSRILSAHGIRVIGLASRMDHFCCRTRTSERIVASKTSGPELVTTLQSLCKEFGEAPVLIPCTDLSVLTISKYREDLDGYRFVLSEHQLLETLIDKVDFALFAEQQGFAVPKTRVLTVQSDAQQAADDLTFPVFVKPAVKTPKWEANTALKAVRTNSSDELLMAWKTYSEFSDTLIAQEFIHGNVDDCFTVNVYFDRAGNPQCCYASQKTRQWPPDFGTACLAQESNNQSVVDQTLSFFSKLNYRGLGYIEFKRDQRSGEFLIIEPNIGRPTGRSAMADACGVPLMLTAYCDAADLPLPRPCDAPHSERPLKWVHLRRDLQAGIRDWRRGDTTLFRWLRSIQGRRIFAVAHSCDRRPFVSECLQYSFRLLFRKKKPGTMDSPRQRQRAPSDVTSDPLQTPLTGGRMN